jgi:hypothetical protein
MKNNRINRIQELMRWIDDLNDSYVNDITSCLQEIKSLIKEEIGDIRFYEKNETN